MGRIRLGQRVPVVLDSLGRVLEGRVGEIIPAADPASRTVTVKLDLPAVPAFDLPPAPADGSRTVKELMTLNRLRSIIERQRTIGGKNLLEHLSDQDLGKIIGLLEDDRVSEEIYVQKLDMMLGVVTDPASESADVGSEGQEVLKTWEQMDEGELDFDEGLKEASEASKERGGGMKEPKERDSEPREAEPN